RLSGLLDRAGRQRSQSAARRRAADAYLALSGPSRCGMRATGGTLKFRRSNSSHRSCQMRPITKPSASAAKISKAITTARLIELSPLGQGHYPATQRLLNPFWQDTRGAALGGDGSVDHSASTSWISSDSL